MIAIVNRTEHPDFKFKGTYGKGLQLYSLQFNHKVVGTFTHNYEDGAASCLHAAACKMREIEETEKGARMDLFLAVAAEQIFTKRGKK